MYERARLRVHTVSAAAGLVIYLSGNVVPVFQDTEHFVEWRGNKHKGAQSEGITAPATLSHVAAQVFHECWSDVFKMKIQLTRGILPPSLTLFST